MEKLKQKKTSSSTESMKAVGNNAEEKTITIK